MLAGVPTTDFWNKQTRNDQACVFLGPSPTTQRLCVSAANPRIGTDIQRQCSALQHHAQPGGQSLTVEPVAVLANANRLSRTEEKGKRQRSLHYKAGSANDDPAAWYCAEYENPFGARKELLLSTAKSILELQYMPPEVAQQPHANVLPGIQSAGAPPAPPHRTLLWCGRRKLPGVRYKVQRIFLASLIPPALDATAEQLDERDCNGYPHTGSGQSQIDASNPSSGLGKKVSVAQFAGIHRIMQTTRRGGFSPAAKHNYSPDHTSCHYCTGIAGALRHWQKRGNVRGTAAAFPVLHTRHLSELPDSDGDTQAPCGHHGHSRHHCTTCHASMAHGRPKPTAGPCSNGLSASWLKGNEYPGCALYENPRRIIIFARAVKSDHHRDMALSWGNIRGAVHQPMLAWDGRDYPLRLITLRFPKQEEGCTLGHESMAHECSQPTAWPLSSGPRTSWPTCTEYSGCAPCENLQRIRFIAHDTKFDLHRDIALSWGTHRGAAHKPLLKWDCRDYMLQPTTLLLPKQDDPSGQGCAHPRSRVVGNEGRYHVDAHRLFLPVRRFLARFLAHPPHPSAQFSCRLFRSAHSTIRIPHYNHAQRCLSLHVYRPDDQGQVHVAGPSVKLLLLAEQPHRVLDAMPNRGRRSFGAQPRHEAFRNRLAPYEFHKEGVEMEIKLLPGAFKLAAVHGRKACELAVFPDEARAGRCTFVTENQWCWSSEPLFYNILAAAGATQQTRWRSAHDFRGRHDDFGKHQTWLPAQPPPRLPQTSQDEELREGMPQWGTGDAYGHSCSSHYCRTTADHLPPGTKDTEKVCIGAMSQSTALVCHMQIPPGEVAKYKFLSRRSAVLHWQCTFPTTVHATTYNM